MVRRYVSEFGAKAGIYGLSFVMLLSFLLFVQGARNYRAATSAAVSAGLTGESSSAPQAAESLPPSASGTLPPRAESSPASGGAAAGEEAGMGFLATHVHALDTAFLDTEIARMAALGVALSRDSLTYMGPFHATAYCCEVYPHICGGNGVTASGTVPTPGLTVAADWAVLPAGTWLFIAGVGIRRVEDTGSAIRETRLDVAVDTHDNALRWPGFGRHDVWVIAWGKSRA